MDDLLKEFSAEGQLAEDLALGRAVSKGRISEAKYKAALRVIEAQQQEIDLLTSLGDRPPSIPWVRPAASRRRASGTAVLICSDWHVEERVDLAQVNGLNEHSPPIAVNRNESLTKNTIMLLDDARHLTKIDTMVVALLGDFITGYIHPELEESNYMSPVEACGFAEDLIERMIRTFRKECRLKQIIIPTCVGNHGRTTNKTRIGTMTKNSFEQGMYRHLARCFRNDPKIHWQIGEAYENYLTIEGHDVRFHHGDAIVYNNGIGGSAVGTNRVISDYNKTRTAKLDFFGHLHNWLNHRTWVGNGSVIGRGAYGAFKGFANQPPCQTFAIIDPERAMTRALQVFCD